MKPNLKNGSINYLLPEDRPAHHWYRFVLSFPPHLVRHYLTRFGINTNHCVLDPFCGTGTTLVESKKHGIRSIGIEANPMAHFASCVKTDWKVSHEALLAESEEVARAARNELESQGIHDDAQAALDGLDGIATEELLALPQDRQELLLKDSISPLPLHKTLVLLRHLQGCADSPVYAHQRLALAKALVDSIGNLHFGPEVGVGKLKPDAPVLSAWVRWVRQFADDITVLQSQHGAHSEVYREDARQIAHVIEPQSIDAVITSPPYPNEKDYTRTTRLESVLLGFIRDKSELRAMKQSLLRSNTRNVYVGDDDDQWVESFPVIQQLADQIEARRVELGKTSGFERLYARTTRLYFGGMARHLADIRPCLRQGAYLAYVVGDQASYLRIMIRTGELIAAIATSLGYELIDIDLFRTRLATATRDQLREEVVVLRWKG
jgi:hypothetical protein